MPRSEEPVGPEAPAARASLSHPRSRTPRLHRVADAISEALLYLMVIFTPWAFGTTERWSVWTMNVTGYLLGGLLLTKWFVRWRRRYQPDRFDRPAAEERAAASEGTRAPWRWCTISLATLTVLLLLYCAISALNARATFLLAEERFEYHSCLKWLPHSYDAPRTWFAFWQYLGLACFFWALRDWLLLKTRRDRRRNREDISPRSGGARTLPGRQGPDGSEGQADADLNFNAPRHAARPTMRDERELLLRSAGHCVPVRLRRLLWILCLNGALLALVGTLQRLDGTNKLLWLVEPRFNRPGEAVFGPYAYRSNAAQYLNLLWPVCLGFWWTLRQERHARRSATVRIGSGPELLLIPCVVLMAASPIISASRGGVAVAAMSAVVASIVVGLAGPGGGWPARLAVGLIVGAALSLGVGLGWPKLRQRLMPPVTALPTHYGPTQTNDLTLHCLLAVPSQPPARSRVLVGITEQAAQFDAPGTVFLFLSSAGSLHGFAYGDRYTNTLQVVHQAFMTNHAGQTVAVTMVKTTNAMLYVNGQPVATREYARGQPPASWSDPIGTGFLWLFREPALAGAFFNYALDPDEIRTLVDQGPPESTGPAAPPGFTSGFAEGLDGFASELGGTLAHPNIDGIAGENDWLKLERTASPGPLLAQRVDPARPLSAGQRARVRLTAFNPGSLDYAISAGWNEAVSPPVIVCAGAKMDLSLLCTNTSPTAADAFRILATVAGRTGSQELPAGSSLYVRQVHFEPLQLIAAVDTRKIRLQHLLQDGLGGRAEIRNNARLIAHEFPWFGTGPGTFGSVYHLYRSEPRQVWHAYLHDDWLETRVTLGRIGFALVLLLLLMVPLRWFLSGFTRPSSGVPAGPSAGIEPASRLGHDRPGAAGIRVPDVLAAMLALAVAGCLAHARFDFPFQVYSVLFAFLTLCGVWSVLSRGS